MTALFACFLTFCLAGTSADEIPQALDADDQCASPGCAVNALQRHVRGSEEELMEWHEDYYGHKPRSDISVSNYKSLMKNISVQQNAIMALWNRSLELEVEVQEQVKQVEHDSGLKVQDYVELVQDVDMSSREHHAKGDQQPREKMVKKWISYMDQEMGMVFKKLNANGQLVAACGTLMSKNPVPLKLQKQTFDSLAQTEPTEPTMPGDHIGIGDELWRSVTETVTNIHTAQKSAADLEDHIKKINKMLVDFNEGKLIPNENPDGPGM